MDNTLKIQAQANVQQANSSLKKLQQTLQGTGQEITREGKIFDKQGNLISQTLSIVEKKGDKLYRTIQRLDKDGNLRSLSQSITNVKEEAEKTTNVFAKLKDIIGIGAILAGVKTIGSSLYEVTTKAIDYSESLNLFNVVFKNIEKDGETVFSEVGEQATNFQKKLQKNFGTDRTESMYFQGLYQSMAQSQGIADKYANIMSENTTKLTYDLSSLFNANQKDTAEALRAGIYAGQTKPLRSYGIDITETTLQSTLDKLKNSNSSLANMQVSTMSQAEKQILRYISVLEQAEVAQGDFANTIDSPANQLKIFKDQITETGVAVGNLFIEPLQKLLTFANTVVIVIKQVANAIASLFGIKIKDYNTGIASLADAYDDVGDSAGGASKKVKELQRQVLAFDNINNINEPKDNKNGSGSGSDSGINQALLDALKGYDNGLDRVRLKAQKIADTIMSWLGFTYDAETETWKFGKAYDNLIDANKRLGKALAELGKYRYDDLINFYKNFLKPVAKWTIGTGLPKFVDITANGIMKTDWANLNVKLNNFYKAMAPFSINIGEGLLWFYEKVLTPLGSFTIGKVIPEFIDLLANGLNILNNTIDVIKPAVNFLWDNFLSPIAKWTGGVAVSVLKDINSVFNLISKNKVASTVASLATAFLLVQKNGGLVKASMSLLNTVFGTTSKNVKDSKEKTSLLNSVLSKLSKSVKDLLNPIGKLATSIKTASKEENTFATKTKNSGTILDLFKSKVKNADTSVKNLGNRLKNIKVDIKDMNNQLKNGIQSWYNTTTGVEKLKTAMVSIGGAVASLQGLNNSLKDINENGANFGNVSTSIVSAFGNIASSATTGASIGGAYGAVIGGVAGAIGTVVTALKGWKDGQDELDTSMADYIENMDGYISSLQQASNEALINSKVQIEQLESTQQLSTELEGLIDANGRVKSGYEERVTYILNELNKAFGTEYQLDDGLIKCNGEVVKSYGEIKGSIDQVIESRKAQIILEQYEAVYTEALKTKTQAEETYKNKVAETIKKYEDKIAKAKNENEVDKLLKKSKEELEKAENKKNKAVQESEKTIRAYSNLTKAVQENDVKGIEKNTKTLMGGTEKSVKSITQVTDSLAKSAETQKKKIKEAQEQFEKWKSKQITIGIDADTSRARSNINRFGNDLKNSGLGIQYNPISTYANGGFPEEGPFYMNRGEIAGKFSNGKSVVANNQQITDGIKYAVMEGMAEVMNQYGGMNNVKLDITTEEGIIVKKAVDGINRITESTGDCPIKVM